MNAYQLPNSIESEAVVLASCMLDVDAQAEVLSKITAQDFYNKKHISIFKTMERLCKDGQNIDLGTVSNHNQEVELKYLVDLCSSVITTTNYKHHLETIQKKSILRNIIKTTETIKENCLDPYAEIDIILDKAEKEMFSINKTLEQEVSTISESLTNALEQLESRYNMKGSINGLPTGFKSLDGKTGGLQAGELYIIAGRPSMGKTSLAENIATHNAIFNNKGVLFFSMEMKKERIIDRMISSIGLIDSNKLKTGLLEESDWEKVAETVGVIGNGKMYIDDTPNIKAIEIKAKARRMNKKEKIDLIVVDHLTEMWRPMAGKDVQEHEQNVREMKRLATELNIPVILLQQLNRGVEHRADKRPILSDLKETGASEEVADVVMLLYRDEYYNADTENKGIAEVIIAKGRNIGTGTIELGWLANFTKFTDNVQEIKQNNTNFKQENDNKKRKFREWA